MLCNRQLVDGILCLRPRSVRPARGPPTPPARAAAKTRTALTAQTSAAARAAFAAQAAATARAEAKVEPTGISNPHPAGAPPDDVGLDAGSRRKITGLRGCEDRPGTESTAEGQATQGRGVLSANEATVSRNHQQAGMAISPCAVGLCSYQSGAVGGAAEHWWCQRRR